MHDRLRLHDRLWLHQRLWLHLLWWNSPSLNKSCWLLRSILHGWISIFLNDAESLTLPVGHNLFSPLIECLLHSINERSNMWGETSKILKCFSESVFDSPLECLLILKESFSLLRSCIEEHSDSISKCWLRLHCSCFCIQLLLDVHLNFSKVILDILKCWRGPWLSNHIILE